MEPEKFTWRVTSGTTTQRKFSVLVATFGDGYEQVAAKGINNVSGAWNISITGLDADISAVEDFLDRHAGVRAFYWDAPRKGQVLVRTPPGDLAYSTTPAGVGMSTLTTTFKQVITP
ncbi:phage tail protein [Herbaspirillum sp. CAH-3]|jgi:phage-related protein|uniref:phage tail protein n=1 Tax=Herbaspirillum sp. CAH-3 TaxID=2605746 RepID=UPI0012ACCEB9|nr:phage tail protein [Herbaspirillum sp. CAH-3]MRT27644.1 phage tail protein [Herbaspirillum sp. CAH-3]